MSMDSHSDWRDVIRAYLDATWEDQRRRHAADLSGCEALCLKELASEAVWREHRQLIQRRIEEMEKPPPESAYELVEESDERAIAQIIPPHMAKGPPWFATRFVLENYKGGWKIVQIWQACLCNPVSMPKPPDADPSFLRQLGRCFACGGSGQFPVPKTVGLWIFRRQVPVPSRCSFCHGKGICMQCEESSQPGWRSAFDWFESGEAEIDHTSE
jgi:hypothetical protein